MAHLNRGLIVSCQAVKGEPLYGLGIMKYMARAAVAGGAVGIRANYVSDIEDIRTEVDVPIICIIKAEYEDSEVYITPTKKEVDDLINCGAKVIALDATLRKRPGGVTLKELVEYVREKAPDVELMADCSDYTEAKIAVELGFDYVGTTLRGYTAHTKGTQLPDVDFIAKLVKDFPDTKIIAEGGIWERGQLEKVWATGVYAVVIGSAITRPRDITKRFAEVINK